MIRISLITFRRPTMLPRAIASIQAQTLTNWRLEVLNDDPDDDGPRQLVASLGDSRISLPTPQRRGGTGNMNHAFRQGPETFGALLEDDNWWEPEFLEVMVAALTRHPSAVVATANERVWREEKDGTWTRTDRTLRPERDATWLFELRPEDKCGGAILANSALMVRLAGHAELRTPAGIPVDVTELYRERVVPHPLVVHDRVLVNFAQTQSTHRSPDPTVWTRHQMLLIGSVFAALPSESARRALASSLFIAARAGRGGSLVALTLTGYFVPAASALWHEARLGERARMCVHLGRQRHRLQRYRGLLADQAEAWTFLQNGWVADALRNGKDASSEGQ